MSQIDKQLLLEHRRQKKDILIQGLDENIYFSYFRKVTIYESKYLQGGREGNFLEHY